MYPSGGFSRTRSKRDSHDWVREARVQAVFAARAVFEDGREHKALRLACRSHVAGPGASAEAEANNA